MFLITNTADSEAVNWLEEQQKKDKETRVERYAIQCLKDIAEKMDRTPKTRPASDQRTGAFCHAETVRMAADGEESPAGNRQNGQNGRERRPLIAGKRQRKPFIDVSSRQREVVGCQLDSEIGKAGIRFAAVTSEQLSKQSKPTVKGTCRKPRFFSKGRNLVPKKSSSQKKRVATDSCSAATSSAEDRKHRRD